MKFIDMFKEESGKLSFSRVSGFIVLVCYLVCMVYIVIKEKRIADIPPMLLTLILGLYGINKIVNVLNNKVKEQNRKQED